VIISLVALASIAPGHVFDIAPGWIPFGALLVANVVSLAVGVIMSIYPKALANDLDLSYGSLSRPGRWLLLSGLANKGSLLVATALIGHFAGNEALGYAEAARQVAQPVMVLGMGLADVFSPRMMESAHRKDGTGAAEPRRQYFQVFWALGLAYLLIASFDWVGNPMAWLIPDAYTIGGLVAVSILANLIVSAVYPYRLELMGGRSERAMALVDVWAGLAPILVGLTSALLGAFARPFGLMVNGGVQTAGYRRASRDMYQTSPQVAQPWNPYDPPLSAGSREIE
jgi:O-antigen/teichoic acid export membrane protein